MKKFLSIILCMIFLLSAFSANAFADEEEPLADIVTDEFAVLPLDGDIEVEFGVGEREDFDVDETDVWLDEELVASGSCGDGVSWELSKDFVLYIFVSQKDAAGVMQDYAAAGDTPWNTYASSITGLVVMKGVTHIGNLAFSRFTSLKTVSIEKNLVSIGTEAFSGCTALSNVSYAGSAAAWSAVSVGTGNEPLKSAVKEFKEHTAGDVNADGIVNTIDFITLYKLYNGDDTVRYDDSATDINSDGTKADFNDVITLMKYLAGADVEIH